MPKTIDAEARTTASPEQVWALLADASTWSQWGAWSRVEVEGGGPQQVGSIRRLRRWPYTLRERVTNLVPNERMDYELVEGMRIENYRATATIEAAPDGGSIVRWHSEYDKAGPITGAILRSAIKDACSRVARAAAQ
jgi:hypothetical protein